MRVDQNMPPMEWKELAAAAKAAEAAGYDAISCSELAHEPFMRLALIAVATERAQLASSIAVAFPRSPMVVASMAWDLHVQSGGRFYLGLGTQVKGHNERRFSVPWSAPQPRLKEYIEALRAIWRTWEKGDPLDYRGEHYSFTLMTPEFSPKPSGLPMVPISIAAVGPAMLRLGGRLCDGVRLHSFCTRKYMEESCMPQIEEGMRQTGRRRENIEIHGGGFVATGPDEAAVQRMVEWVRYRVAFYGSTRTYWPVWETHGLQDLGEKLRGLVAQGKWNEIAAQVPDDVVRLFAAVGTYDTIANAIAERFTGADTVRISFEADTPLGLQREIIQDVQSIACPFKAYADRWAAA